MTGYTSDEIDKIATLLRDGLSASRIAEAIGVTRHETVSRNAIIGVVRRNPTLKAIGFSRSKGGQSGGRPRKDRMSSTSKPKSPKVRLPKPPAPYTLPDRLAVREFNGRQGAEPHFRFKVPIPRPPAATQRPPFVGMRFLDCLFDRCRMPLDLDSHAKGGPDMLCCGIQVEPLKSFCAHCASRLQARREEPMKAAA
jgi:GcrA cell cycle regulator